MSPARDTRLRRRGRPRDEGSAVAEFVMVSALVLLLGVGVFQLGLVLHVRNTLIACAAEGARVGARADSTTAAARARTTTLIAASLSADYAQDVVVRSGTGPDGIPVVEVSITAPTPVIGLLGPSDSMTVTGRAFDEHQVATP